MSQDCLFCKIAQGIIPANKLHEDDDVVAFWDISPQAPKHFLVIPKRHIAGPAAVDIGTEALVGRMIRVAGELAAECGIGGGYRLVMNNGAEAGQTVFHLHLHVLGGRPMGWPPG
ncbi:MAG: histidine triad nucleotide-binding protein [Thermodesulfobacteriota bacterium]